MATKLKNGETILFIGDSITDAGRRGPDRPLGVGYVKQFVDLLTIREPAKRVTVINTGVSGNTVRDLQDRWTDDMLRHKPDWLSIKIGINDVHRTLNELPTAVPPDMFAEVYEEILTRTVQQLPRVKLLLIDPFYISLDMSPHSARTAVAKLLPKYITTVHRMSRKFKTRLVKTDEMFKKFLKFHAPDYFCNEPIHPNLSGHLAIAEAVYNALSR